MRRLRRAGTIALILALAACADDPVAPATGVQPWVPCGPVAEYWPTRGWRSACPGALGLDTVRLRGALHALDTMPAVRSFVVARRGHIGLEAYYRGTTARTSFELRSVTKMLMATLVGAAVEEGSLDALAHPLRDYWPEVIDGDADPRKRTLTVDHLLDLTAGFPLAYSALDTSTYPAPAPLLSRKLAADPGARWVYDEPLYHLLSLVLRIETGKSALDLARRRVFAPLGIDMSARRWDTDGAGNPLGYTGASLTARELLTIGELHRRGGTWDGARILPAGWTEYEATRPPGIAPDSVLWRRGWRQVEWDGRLLYVAVGYGGQYVFVVPSLEMLVVATCDPHATRFDFWPPIEDVVSAHVLPAAR
jgi:CubicO group peptidase (beta-lactamase class C family)